MIATLFLLPLAAALPCSTTDSITTGHAENWEFHFTSYSQTGSPDLYLFTGSLPGQTSFFLEHFGNWQGLGNLLFLDVAGAGYSRYKRQISSISGLAQLYAEALNQIRTCLPYQYTKLYVVSSGVMSKVAFDLCSKEEIKGLVLLSPIVDFLQNIRYLPSVAFNMGIVDYQERSELEYSVLSKATPSYEDYLKLVNKVAKLSGDMQTYDYRKYEIDTTTVQLTNHMNTDASRTKYGAQSQFFFTQGLEAFNSIQTQLSQNMEADIQKVFNNEAYKIAIFVPQFSLSSNIPGTMAQFSKYFKGAFKIQKSKEGFPLYASKDTLYIIQDSGDRLYIDKKELLLELIKQSLK